MSVLRVARRLSSKNLRPVGIALIVALCAGVSCDPTVRDAATGGVMVKAESNRDRVVLALERVSATSLSATAAERLEGAGKKVAIDAPAKVRGVPDGVEVVDLMADGELVELLHGSDERVVAETLRAKGIDMVLLHAQVTPSVDRGGTLISRLYHHDFLEYFNLFRVTDGALLYQVRERPVAFPPQLAAACLQYLRMRLEGKRPASFPDIPSDTGNWTFVATIRGQGKELAIAFSRDVNLRKALEELVSDLETEHRRQIELFGFPPLSEHVADLSIEIQRVVERAYVEPRGEETLEALWEMGIDGAFIMSPDQKERGVLPGSVSYTRAIRDADGFLRKAGEQGRMSQRRWWRDESAWLEMFRTVHYREVPGEGIAFVYRGVSPVPMSRVTVASARRGVLDAGDWYLNNLQPDGSVVYKFWPAENRYSNEYNLVRHTLATWNLVQAYNLDPKPEYLEGAQRALDFTNKYLKREQLPDGQTMAYYSYNNNQKLGTVVVNLLGMVELARATDDKSMDPLMIELGRFVKFMQMESGTFDGYHVPDDHPYADEQNDIVPGEAALSLVYLAEYFDDDSWIEGLPRYWEYYYPWFEERVVKSNPGAPWPAYTYDNDTRLELVQFGPWTVMAANAYHRRTGDEKVARFGLRIARWMIDTYEWTEETAPFPDYVGGYYKLPGELPAMQAFCYAEGTAAAYLLALRMAPDEKDYFEVHTREAVRFGLQMQFDKLSDYPFSRPMQVRGGIRYAMNETKVRIDYVHHALSAMYQWHEGAKSDPTLADEIKNGPEGIVPRDLAEEAAKARKAQADAARAAGALPPAPDAPQSETPDAPPAAPVSGVPTGAPAEGAEEADNADD